VGLLPTSFFANYVLEVGSGTVIGQADLVDQLIDDLGTSGRSLTSLHAMHDLDSLGLFGNRLFGGGSGRGFGSLGHDVLLLFN